MPPWRSQTDPAEHVDPVVHAEQPLLCFAQDWVWILLVGEHCAAPMVHPLMQHLPPLHAPFVQVIVPDSYAQF
jgi:hypothetical protein